MLAGAGGVAGGFVPEHEPTPPVPNPQPAELVAAARRERALIADLDATTGGSPALRRVLVRARGDHAAHLATFQQLLAAYDPPDPPDTDRAVSSSAPSATKSAGAAPDRVKGTPRTSAQLRAAEQRAAVSAARGAAASTGRMAVVLASVSASESSHAALIQ